MNKKKDPYGYVYERNTTVNMKCTSIAGMEFILSTIVSKASLNQMKLTKYSFLKIKFHSHRYLVK